MVRKNIDDDDNDDNDIDDDKCGIFIFVCGRWQYEEDIIYLGIYHSHYSRFLLERSPSESKGKIAKDSQTISNWDSNSLLSIVRLCHNHHNTKLKLRGNFCSCCKFSPLECFLIRDKLSTSSLKSLL